MSEARRSLLIVEDDPALQKQMCWAFDQYATIVAGDRESALQLLEEVHALAPDAKVIVLTGQNDRSNALKAIALGAYDFCEKPFEPALLGLMLERAFRVHDLQEENRRLQAAQQPRLMAGLITRDPGMQKICRTVEKIAPTSATLLIVGESGTGKELLARALHDFSPRKSNRFVAINCGAIPETLLESELFGYEKGAFTGAAKQTIGKLETAHTGTLFLDEVGDLPLALQVKLLRFLQERVIERVGGRQEIPIDVRIVCATNQNLKDLTSAGKFREDLYYRLAEIVLEVPALRARNGDAALLAHGFVHRFAAELKRGSMTLLPDAVAAIEAHAWPGNVRELENVIRRAVIMADGSGISAADIGIGSEAGERETTQINLRQVREEAEKHAVLRALGRVNGNLSKAADLLGVSRPTLYELMHRFGLK